MEWNEPGVEWNEPGVRSPLFGSRALRMLMRPMTLRNGVHIGRRFVVLQGTGVRAIAYVEHVPRPCVARHM